MMAFARKMSDWIESLREQRGGLRLVEARRVIASDSGIRYLVTAHFYENGTKEFNATRLS